MGKTDSAVTLNDTALTDLEATRLCAEAMGLEHRVVDDSYVECRPHPLDQRWWLTYYPLHDDAQAMALVKRFNIGSDRERDDPWVVAMHHSGNLHFHDDADLNRAIVYCVAQMQSATIREGSDGN